MANQPEQKPPAQAQVAASSPPQPTYTVEEVEQNINSLLNDIQKQNLNQVQLQSTLLLLQQQMNNLTAITGAEQQKNARYLASVKKAFEALKRVPRPRCRRVEDIPGIRMLKWYQVNIEFQSSDDIATIRRVSPYPLTSEGSIGISPEGPFVVTQISALWQNLDLNYQRYSNTSGSDDGPPATTQLELPPLGRYLPVSALFATANNLGRTNPTSNGFNTPSISQLSNETAPVDNWQEGPLKDLPEFDVQIKIAGNGRLYSDIGVAGHMLFTDSGEPLYLSTLGIFEKNDRITVLAKNNFDIKYYGRLKIIFHGYQIMNPIIAADLLGY